jgi:hypothetical protein
MNLSLTLMEVITPGQIEIELPALSDGGLWTRSHTAFWRTHRN